MGIQCYDPQTKRLWKVLKNQSVSDIAFLSKDSVLFATPNEGIFLLEISQKRIRPFVKLPSMSDVPVFLKPAHLPSHFWLGTDRSLYLFNAQEQSFIDFSNLREEGITMKDCYLDTQNQITWLASSVGLLKHDFAIDATLLQVDLPKKLVAFPVKVTCFFHENSERNWLGLSHTGVLSWNEKNNDFQMFAIPNGAPVNQLLKDDTGNLLACTQRAIFRLNLEKSLGKSLFLFPPISKRYV
jgi:ligand-binding sensor domain-containing protein